MGAQLMLAEAERERLLGVAREAIAAALARQPYTAPSAAGVLAAPCGAFVSLHERASGALRGCIGSISAREPLVETVAHMAAAAATRDDRFAPVRAEELGRLAIEISVLAPLAPVRPEDVRVGVHGLMVRCDRASGLLLPQVPLQHGWDRERFLAMTCRKAGLPEDAWRRPDCELLAFEAEVFGERHS